MGIPSGTGRENSRFVLRTGKLNRGYAVAYNSFFLPRYVVNITRNAETSPFHLDILTRKFSKMFSRYDCPYSCRMHRDPRITSFPFFYSRRVLVVAFEFVQIVIKRARRRTPILGHKLVGINVERALLFIAILVIGNVLLSAGWISLRMKITSRFRDAISFA